MNRFAATFVLVLAAPALADTVERWIQERAADYREYAERPVTSSGAVGHLWRERPSSDHSLPEFVPPTSLAPLIKAVRETVVNISAALENGRRSTGSGFVITADGLVVTNNHVIDKSQQITVKLSDGREFLANVVGKDPSTDLALLTLRGAGNELPATFLGNSDQLQVGDWVVAIGNPFGLDHSVAHGMISAKERVIGVGVFDDFIQTDALINPGNSGGPLFNMRGEVVGVNTAIVSQGQGIGFAVPINMVKDLLPNLRNNGRLARGWLGVNIREEDVGPTRGAVVKDVFKGSPAAIAGLRTGDLVTAVNGRAIDSYLQLLRRVAILAPGSEAKLTVRRAGASKEIVVKLSERPAPEAIKVLANGQTADAFGLVLRDVSDSVAQSLGIEPFSGVLVAGVLPGSSADQAGLRAGDLITEVNRKAVQDLRSFRAALERAGPDKTSLLRYQRGDDARFVAIKP
ncbi:MAG: trypsin-like peptidase domain-containing protein [Myxococcaceae bacterium]